MISALSEWPPSRVRTIPASLRLFREGPLEAYYAPFDYENPSARVAIVGLTPGWRQAQLSYLRFSELRRQNAPIQEALREAKLRASFEGPMRANLVSMLDSLGLPKWLAIESCADLFGRSASLLHATSALRYPVFKAGQNYSGSGPKPTRSAALLAMVDQLLGPELDRVPNALIIPLGRATSECLQWLSRSGRLQPRRWLWGFPHPSGANGHRHRQFAAHRADLKRQVANWFAGRA
jgi:hypothetical protein